MSMRRSTYAVVTLLVLVVSACTSASTSTEKGDGAVTVALASFSREKLYPPAFDPGGLVYFGPMFDFLIGASPDGRLSTETGALEAYEPNQDASVWTLTLRAGMTWHDGEPVTSDDLAFTLREFGSPEATCAAVCATLQTNLAGIEIVDDRTVPMSLKEPDVTIPAKFGPIESSIVLLPRHHVEKVGWDGFEKEPMGSGPWKFVSRQIGQSITYTANREYWDPARQPGFDDLEIVLAPDQNTRLAMLRSGEADLVAISPDAVPTAEDDGFDVLNIDNTIVSEILFAKSYDPGEMSHRLEFRKALALAIDMDEIVKAFYPSGTGERASGDAVPFSPNTLGHDPSLEPYPYDPDQAERLLEEAGYDGSTVKLWTVTFPDGPEQREVDEAIAGFWSKVGVEVELVPTEFGPLLERLGSGNFDAPPIASVTAFPTSNRPSVLANFEPMMLSPEAGGRFRTYWDPAKLDAYHAEVSRIVDESARDERLREINRELYDEYWSIPIAMKSTPYAAGPRIEGWQPISGVSKVLVYESLRPAP
ncbi:ABC transporter substrate-binding protein [Nocardioides sp. L-11A]|uniref:ABC transporter substrate-binding protein n=1 Tax=Nocardioides sp. L-11A TaxID=3043848 RepID=UPI00249BF09D|nr:ABC transporter substrate-binding protein [Nocardioides sp. L-11A]